MVSNSSKPIIDRYMQDITSGAIPASKWVKLAVKRHLHDLDHGHKRGLEFSENTGQCAIDFFGLLKHSKGEWAGQTFRLEPWQMFIVWVLFGWLRKSDGMRRFRTAYLEVARKNGKSTFAAGIGLLLFIADGEPGAEVYTAATKRDQALIIHSESVRMVKSSPALSKRIRVTKNNLSDELTGSKYEPLGADTDGMDGLNPNGNIIDELHAHKTRACWDVLDTATGSRRQPLLAAITTAGFDQQGICYEQREYSLVVLEGFEIDGGIQDDTFFAIIYTLDEKDAWDDETVWIKANPNLNVSVKLDDLQRKANKAKVSAASQNNFMCKHLNLWVSQEIRWLNLLDWDNCNGLAEDSVLMGGVCVGVDLSSTNDISGYAMVGKDIEGNYHIKPRFFIPGDNAHQREIRHNVPYTAWQRLGLITMTPGDRIDYDFIRKSLCDDLARFPLLELAFDPWNASQFITQLVTMDGFDQNKLVEFRQGYRTMNEPSKEFERITVEGEIRHGGNPILRWMAGNVAITQDPVGNIKPVKPLSVNPKKIDGIVMAIMAIGRGMLNPGDGVSVYETRGLIAI